MEINFSILTDDGVDIPLLGVNGEFTTRQVNEAFSFDDVAGAWVLGMEIPAEDNTEALSQGYHWETTTKYNLYSALMKRGAEVLHQGLLRVDTVNGQFRGAVINADFVVDDLVYRAKDVTIKDVCDIIIDMRPNGLTDIRQAANFYNLRQFPEVVVRFPNIRNEGFYGDNNENFSGNVNAFNADNQAFEETSLINATGAGSEYLTVNNLVPNVYMMEVLRCIGGYFGYILKGSMVNDPTQFKWEIIGGLAMDNAESIDRASLSAINIPVSQRRISLVNTNDRSVLFNQVNDDNTYFSVDVNNSDPYTITEEGIWVGEVTLNFISYFIQDVGNTAPQIGYRIHVRTGDDTGFGVQSGIISYEWQTGGTDSQISTEAETFQFVITPTAGEIGETLGVFLEVFLTGGTTGNESKIELVTADFIISRLDFDTQNVGLETFRLGDTLPPTGVMPFLKTVKNLFCTTLEIDSANKVITMDYAKDGLSKPPEYIPEENVVDGFIKTPTGKNKYKLSLGNLSDLPANLITETRARIEGTSGAPLYSSILIENENAYYEYTFDSADGLQKWRRVGQRGDEVVLGEGEEVTIEPELVVPDMQVVVPGWTGSETRKYLVPVVNFTGASAILGMPKETSHELSLLFRGGFQRTGNGGAQLIYPFSTTTGLNAVGEPIGPLSTVRTLAWDGANGLLCQYWDVWLKMLVESEPVEIPLKLVESLKRGKNLNRPLIIQGQRIIIQETVITYAQEEIVRVLGRKLNN